MQKICIGKEKLVKHVSSVLSIVWEGNNSRNYVNDLNLILEPGIKFVFLYFFVYVSLYFLFYHNNNALCVVKVQMKLESVYGETVHKYTVC